MTEHEEAIEFLRQVIGPDALVSFTYYAIGTPVMHYEVRVGIVDIAPELIIAFNGARYNDRSIVLTDDENGCFSSSVPAWVLMSLLEDELQRHVNFHIEMV